MKRLLKIIYIAILMLTIPGLASYRQEIGSWESRKGILVSFDAPVNSGIVDVNEGAVLFGDPNGHVTWDVDNLYFDDTNDILDVNALIISGTKAIGLDMSTGTFATAIQKWPAGTIQTTGTTIFQPDANSTTSYQWLDAGGTPVLTVSTSDGVVTIPGIGDGGLTSYDLKVGTTGTPTYGMIQMGNSVIGRTSYKAGNIDLDGTILLRNISGPVTSEIEFIWTESAGNTCRFALPKSAVGNATYNSRSMLLAGPAPADTDMVKVSYWQTANSIFDNLLCDTDGTGADLGVQNDLEVEGDIFTDSIKESTSGAGVSIANDVRILNQKEVRFYNAGSSNYVGFEAPTLSANQIWQLPPTDGSPGSVLGTNGFGGLNWAAAASEKAWAFMSRDASSGTNYIGGYYKFETTDNDFNPSVTFGTVNASYAAHLFLVQAAGASGGTDTVVRVTGTTINDQGTRTAAVDVDITVDDAGAAGTYYETSEKWLGQVTIAKQSGPDLLCNYGFCKYWDDNNTNFRIVGIEATWLGAKNDNTPDIKLRHHKATGWTYNNAAAPTPPTELASMATDHNTEIYIRAAEEGAWKRDNLSTNVQGSSGEGTIIELATTTNRTYAIGNFMMRIAAGTSENVIFNGENVIFNGEQVVYP